MREIDAFGGKIDPLIVLEKLKNEKVYDDANGKQYLLQLSQLVPSTENVEAYARIIREKFYVDNESKKEFMKKRFPKSWEKAEMLR